MAETRMRSRQRGTSDHVDALNVARAALRERLDSFPIALFDVRRARGIALGTAAGETIQAIARRLGRAPSTVFRARTRASLCPWRTAIRRCRAELALRGYGCVRGDDAMVCAVSVRVARGVVTRIRQDPGAITIQAADASDRAEAAGALRRAREDIANLDGGSGSAYGLAPGDRNSPKWVSDVIEIPSGPMLMIDGGFTPVRLLREIPAIVARRLEEAGVSAVLMVPRTDGPLERLRDAAGCVLLRAYPLPPRGKRLRVAMPDQWLSEASAWVLDGVADDDLIMCSLQAVEFMVARRSVASLLGGWERDRPGYAVLCAGDATTQVRGIAIDFSPENSLELALFTGGPEVGSEGSVAGLGQLQAIARRLAPTVGYAFISIEPTLAQVLTPITVRSNEWHEVHDGPNPSLAQWLCDEVVPDAFAYQILGPLHARRLAGIPLELTALTATRWELAIGSAEDWVFIDSFDPDPIRGLWHPEARRDPGIQARARALLQPCLTSTDEARQLMTRRLTTPGSED